MSPEIRLNLATAVQLSLK